MLNEARVAAPQDVETMEAWTEADLERLQSCPLCRSHRTTVVHPRMVDRVFGSVSGPWSWKSCADCGCGFLDPRPTVDTVGRAYANYYTHEGRVDATVTPTGLAWLRKAIANGYRNQLYGTQFRPTLGRIGATSLQFSARHRHEIEAQAVGLQGVRPTAPGTSRLLDVGCGSGNLLKFARSAGWLATGLEPDPAAAAAARASSGAEVMVGGVEQVPASLTGCFERITMSHVIEHVHDPVDVLSRCRELLAPGGSLWLETPNVDSAGHASFGADWRGLEPPRHLILFNSAALESTLRRAGFAQIRPGRARDVLQFMTETSLQIQIASRASRTSLEPLTSAERARARSLADHLRELASAEPQCAEFIQMEASR